MMFNTVMVAKKAILQNVELAGKVAIDCKPIYFFLRLCRFIFGGGYRFELARSNRLRRIDGTSTR
jgi:hypothetical protein